MSQISSLLSWLKQPVQHDDVVRHQNTMNPSPALEKQLGEQIYNALQEVACAIAAAIQGNFIPSLESIC